jgi:hypothetical protein
MLNLERVMNTTFDNFDIDSIIAGKVEESAQEKALLEEERKARILSRQFYPLFRGFPNGSKEYYDRLELLDSEGLSEQQIILSFMDKEDKKREESSFASKVRLIFKKIKSS